MKFSGILDRIDTHEGVYQPQADSILLVDALFESGIPYGARVLDMCTGTGILALVATQLGVGPVMAFDISAGAQVCAQRNSARLGMTIDVRLGSVIDAVDAGPFDVVVSNPPYVATPSVREIPHRADFNAAWDGGADGRAVLDVLCASATSLLAPGGYILVVQSEYADVTRTENQLRDQGLKTSVVARRVIPFGPVMSARAAWLESRDIIEAGCRTEELVVVRADRATLESSARF